MRRGAVRAGLLTSVLLATATTAADAGRDPAPGPALRGGELAARIERALAVRARDPRLLGAALTALGDPGPAPADDLAFLVEFLAREPSRALRLLAAESAQRLDATGAVDRLLTRAREEKDAARTAWCVEAAGLVGGRADAPRLVPFLDHASGLVVVAAADALARCGTEAEAREIARRAPGWSWSVATDHGVWAVLDMSGSRARAAALFREPAGGTDASRTARLAAVEAALADAKLLPHRWAPPFGAARKALAAASQSPKVSALNPAMHGWIEDALRWLREKAPAESWTVCAALRSIETADARTRLDEGAGKVVLSYDDTGLPPEKLACLLFRAASVLFRRRVGEPASGRRAWDAAIAESWELCVAGKVHDAAARGMTRERFLDRALEFGPWEVR